MAHIQTFPRIPSGSRRKTSKRTTANRYPRSPGPFPVKNCITRFWRETIAGAVLRGLKEQFRECLDPSFQLLGNLLLVPQAQS